MKNVKNEICPDPPSDLLSRCMETIPANTSRVPVRLELSLELPSKTRLRWLTLVAAIPMVTALVVMPIRNYLATNRTNTDIVRLKVIPERCRYPNCQERDYHGRVEVIFSDGTSQPIIGDDLYHTDSPDTNPQIAADHQTAGWLQGEHINQRATLYFLPTRLVIYRHHHRGGWGLLAIQGERGFIEAWHFWNGGRQVAFRTRGLHGVSIVALYEIGSGKVIAKIPGYKVTTTSPQWAQGLGDR